MEKPHEMKTNQLSPKQAIAIGVLSLVLLGVGVWQWQGMSARKPSPRPANSAQSAVASGTQTSAHTAGQTLASASFTPFPARDPFRPTINTETSTPSRVVQPAKASAKTTPREITGTPPVPPLALPAPGRLEVRHVEEPEPPVPNWTLIGVVQGPRTIAILKDSEGNRRFVQMGDKLEEGWRIWRIERGKLTLQKGQRTISINVGGSTAESEAPPSRSTGGMQQ